MLMQSTWQGDIIVYAGWAIEDKSVSRFVSNPAAVPSPIVNLWTQNLRIQIRIIQILNQHEKQIFR